MTKLDYDPAYAEYNTEIIKTLQSMTADGRKRNTVKGKGFIIYEKTQDPWRVMLHMGHKKPDTTQHYLSALMAQTNSDEVEYTSKAAQTKEEAMTLIEAGFQYVQTIDGYHIYRKRK